MRRRWILPALSAVLAILLFSLSAPLVRYGLAFVFLWVLPGLAWAILLPRQHLSTVEWLTFGLGLNFLITPLATLFLAYLPGPLTQAHLLLTLLALTTLPLLLAKRADPAPVADAPAPSFWQRPETWLLIALCIAAALRLTNLGYAEFQGDESIVMIRAAQALEGDESILFQHKKGPAELLVVMAQWRLTSITNEWMARLPFTFASLIALAAAFSLARRLTNLRTAALAAGILAIEGYFTAFGRIVQYQSLVFLLSTLGLLALLLYRTTARTTFLFLGAACFSGGFLGHYDAALALPAGLLLLADRWWPHRHEGWPALRPLLLAALLGLALILPFYLPFLTSPFMDHTQTYLAERLNENQVFHNSLWRAFNLSAVYDSIYLLGLLILGLGIALLHTWAKWAHAFTSARTNARPFCIGLALVLCTFLLTAMLWPDRWILQGNVTIAWLPAVILLMGALMAPAQHTETRFLWLWFTAPALFYLFIVASPRTHVHTFFTPGIILGSMMIARLATRLQREGKTNPVVFLTLGGIFYGVCAYYPLLMFVNHTPEYRATFPESRLPLYWTPYEETPDEGLFGFPYRAGWKAVGYLMDQGEVAGYYDSNEELPVTQYYMRQANRWECLTPDFYVIAVNVKDKANVPWEELKTGYRPTITVNVHGVPKITLYERAAAGLPVSYNVEEYAWRFDLNTTPQRMAAYIPQIELTEQEYTPVTYNTGNFGTLRGYAFEAADLTPGGYIDLALFWEARGPAPENYQISTYISDGEHTWGSHTKQPACDTLPTSQWRPGQIVRDRHHIPIEEEAPLGSLDLRIAMYGLQTSQYLPMSEEGKEELTLTRITLQKPTLPATYTPYTQTLGSVIQLRGYTLDTDYAVPGGYVDLTLFWEMLQPATVDYHTFTHLNNGSSMLGQLDKQLVYHSHPTSQWEAGQIVQDSYRIFLAAEAPPGTVPLTVGMYDPATMERLSVLKPDGTIESDVIHLTDIVIQAP